MKGWKTIVFNALMLIGGLTGAKLDPTLVAGFAEEFVAVLAIGNGILRSITDTPVFKGNAARASRHLQGLAVAMLCLLVVGCNGLTQNTGNAETDAFANAVKRVGLACDSYSTSLNTLSALRDEGRLSDATRAEVTRIRNLVGPGICEQDAPPIVLADGRDTIAFIEPLIYDLLQIRRGVGQ